jgi:hypothetical protein
VDVYYRTLEAEGVSFGKPIVPASFSDRVAKLQQKQAEELVDPMITGELVAFEESSSDEEAKWRRAKSGGKATFDS